jgi:hypothetical protein
VRTGSRTSVVNTVIGANNIVTRYVPQQSNHGLGVWVIEAIEMTRPCPADFPAESISMDTVQARSI